MKKKSTVKKTTKKRVWDDCPAKVGFWFRDGRMITNIKQLPAALRKTDQETFLHHVNEERNDFANWVRDVFAEKKLAQQISQQKTKTAIINTIRSRL